MRAVSSTGMSTSLSPINKPISVQASMPYMPVPDASGARTKIQVALAFFLLLQLSLVHLENIARSEYTGQLLIRVDDQQTIGIVAHHQHDGGTQRVFFG